MTGRRSVGYRSISNETLSAPCTTAARGSKAAEGTLARMLHGS
jgi:hypothetical protein